MLSLAGLMLLLTACQTVVSSCPVPKEYTKEQQVKIAEDYQANLNEGRTAITGAIDDYLTLRDKVRTCNE